MTGFDAIGAHHYAFGLSIPQGPDFLKIGIKPSFGNIMGMTDMTSHQRLFPTDFANF
jgi:hypothetical protein